MDLIWDGAELFVAGPDTAAHPSSHVDGTTFVGLRFAPGTAPAILGHPAHVLRDQRVPVEALWSTGVSHRLHDELDAAADPRPVLERIAQARVAASGSTSTLIAAIAAAMRADRPVAEVADEVGLSERQMRRRSLDAFGYGPKTLARILRLQRALELLRAGEPAASTAARAGYSDQPHLSRDARRLTGVPLSRLVRPTI